MTTEVRTNYPTMPLKHWWGLRKAFKRTIPSSVTLSYLETALNINSSSASPLIPQLKLLKIIDDDGKPLDRAYKWRDDDTYVQLCNELIQELYPEELIHGISNPLDNRDAIDRWFARKTKTGTKVTAKMTLFFLLLNDADPAKSQEKGNSAKQNGRTITTVKKHLVEYEVKRRQIAIRKILAIVSLM